MAQKQVHITTQNDAAVPDPDRVEFQSGDSLTLSADSSGAWFFASDTARGILSPTPPEFPTPVDIAPNGSVTFTFTSSAPGQYAAAVFPLNCVLPDIMDDDSVLGGNVAVLVIAGKHRDPGDPDPIVIDPNAGNKS